MSFAGRSYASKLHFLCAKAKLQTWQNIKTYISYIPDSIQNALLKGAIFLFLLLSLIVKNICTASFQLDVSVAHICIHKEVYRDPTNRR